MLRSDVANQTSPSRGLQPQNFKTIAEQFQENQFGIVQVPYLNNSNNSPTDIQETVKNIMTSLNEYNNIRPLTITTPPIGERLLGLRIIELYLPMSPTVVLKSKKEKLYVTLDFENCLTIDALVNSGAYIKAITQNELDRIKQQAPNNIFKTDDHLDF